MIGTEVIATEMKNIETCRSQAYQGIWVRNIEKNNLGQVLTNKRKAF